MEKPWKMKKSLKKTENLEKKAKIPVFKKKKIKNIVVVSILVVGLVGGSIGGFVYYRSKNQKKVEVNSVVSLNSAEWWDDDSSLSGTVTSDYVQEVRLDESKRVEKIYVKAGDKVKEGDKLLKYNVEEEELNLKLQELQIQSATIKIQKMEDDLKLLKSGKMPKVEEDKDTSTTTNNSTGDDLAGETTNDSIGDLLGANHLNVILAEEGDQLQALGEVEGGPEEKTTEAAPEEKTTEAAPEEKTTEAAPEEKTTEAPPEEKTTERKEEPSTTEKKEDTSTTEKKEDTSTTEKKEEKTEATTEMPKPDPNQITPISRVKSVNDFAKSLSHDGKGKDKDHPLVYVLTKNFVDGEHAKVRNQVIIDLMNGTKDEKGKALEPPKYAVFMEYESVEAFQKGEKPILTININPNTIFSDDISAIGEMGMDDLDFSIIKIKKIEIKPNTKKVQTGNSYTFTTKVTADKDSKNKVNVAERLKSFTKWSISGNKSKDTIISNGLLWVGDKETSKKLKVKVKIGDKETSMTMKVEKSKTSDNGGGGGGLPGPNYGGGGNITYTDEEFKEAISSKEEEIAQAKTDLGEAKINYRETKKQVDAATVKAKISGTVQVAYTPDALPSDDSPAVIVRAEEGLYIKTQISEMDLETVKVGGTISCKSWENEEKYQAVVKEISDYPISGDQYQMSGQTESNPNSSYYPIVAYIEKAEGLSPGMTVSISYTAKSMGTTSGDEIYLQKAYVRSDSGGHYVLKADKNMRLKKQYIQTGKTLNGQYIEVLKGITKDDYLAFPYGKKAKEGAKCVEAENDDNIIY